jgi:hypothetical protein
MLIFLCRKFLNFYLGAIIPYYSFYINSDIMMIIVYDTRYKTRIISKYLYISCLLHII